MHKNLITLFTIVLLQTTQSIASFNTCPFFNAFQYTTPDTMQQIFALPKKQQSEFCWQLARISLSRTKSNRMKYQQHYDKQAQQQKSIFSYLRTKTDFTLTGDQNKDLHDRESHNIQGIIYINSFNKEYDPNHRPHLSACDLYAHTNLLQYIDQQNMETIYFKKPHEELEEFMLKLLELSQQLTQFRKENYQARHEVSNPLKHNNENSIDKAEETNCNILELQQFQNKDNDQKSAENLINNTLEKYRSNAVEDPYRYNEYLHSPESHTL